MVTVSILSSTVCKRCLRCVATNSFKTSTRSLTKYHRKESHETDGENVHHFGFETVNEKEKSEKVHRIFENVAETYDLMNDAMSVGIHRLWKDYFMGQLAPAGGTKLLDVAGGTGDIAFRFLSYVENENSHRTDPTISPSNPFSTDSAEDPYVSNEVPHRAHVTVCDLSESMLQNGQKRAEKLAFSEKDISWIQGNAENLPFDEDTFDAYTISFGIRNCVHIDMVLNEAYRVLRPGGRFMCLEFSDVKNPILRSLYDAYSFQLIPVMGQVLAKDWRSYQYLVESIRRFPNQENFAQMIRDAGFQLISYKNLTFGVAAIHSAFKL